MEDDQVYKILNDGFPVIWPSLIADVALLDKWLLALCEWKSGSQWKILVGKSTERGCIESIIP